MKNKFLDGSTVATRLNGASVSLISVQRGQFCPARIPGTQPMPGREIRFHHGTLHDTSSCLLEGTQTMVAVAVGDHGNFKELPKIQCFPSRYVAREEEKGKTIVQSTLTLTTMTTR